MKLKRGSTSPGNRIPRGAIAVVVVGLIATIAAALLTTGKGEGEAAHLEWVQQAKIPESKPVLVPGSKKAKMQLLDGRIQATGTNVADYSLFRVLTTLKIATEAPVGEGRVLCSVHATAPGTLIAQSSGGLRATYPRSSEKGSSTAKGVPQKGIYTQENSETVTMQFASHGYELAVVEVDDLPGRFTNIKGVKLRWPEYVEGTEHLEYFLPKGKKPTPIELHFYTIWKTQKAAAATISCKLKTAAGEATTTTKGSLPKISPPINEEAEAEKLEEKEETEAKKEEGEGE